MFLSLKQLQLNSEARANGLQTSSKQDNSANSFRISALVSHLAIALCGHWCLQLAVDRRANLLDLRCTSRVYYN